MNSVNKKSAMEFWGVDLEKLKSTIESAQKLEDGQAFLTELMTIMMVKKVIKDSLEDIEKLELEAKGLINSKAKALYGDNWQVIKGDSFKITRSKTGDMYLINGTPSAKFVKTKVSVDSKVVDDYVVENSKLPKGIEVNDQRGESIRITLK